MQTILRESVISQPPVTRRPADADRTCMGNRRTHTVAITISTRKKDGVITVSANDKPVVTITRSGRQARIANQPRPIPVGTHRGRNRFQFTI